MAAGWVAISRSIQIRIDLKSVYTIRGRQTNHSAFQLDWENVQHVFEFRWLNHLLVTSWASTIYTQRPKNGGHPFKRAAVVKYVIGLSHLKLSRVYVKRRSHLLYMLANTPTSRELTYETSSWTLEHIGTTSAHQLFVGQISAERNAPVAYCTCKPFLFSYQTNYYVYELSSDCKAVYVVDDI